MITRTRELPPRYESVNCEWAHDGEEGTRPLQDLQPYNPYRQTAVAETTCPQLDPYLHLHLELPYVVTN
jgi:hypothetical protein